MEQKLSTLKDFEVISKLGEGAFGQVYKVKRKLDGKQYALKKIKIASMKPKEKQNALNQVRILASYDHEYIIGYKDAFYDEVSQTLCVVMEFAAGGDIMKVNQTHIKCRTKYKEQQIWTALVHMVTGLKSLHEKKILHRDMKCANIFITADKKYKLGDLNVSKVLEKDFACTQTGTPYYASPEVWKDQPYGVKSDMWSLGCVLYEMAALRPPFTAHDLSGLYKKICAGVFERIPLHYSNDLHAIISSLLKLDPKKRPDTDELLSNPLILKYYKGQLQAQGRQEGSQDPLLRTIKYNPKDLKGLKNILPKSNYIEQEKIIHEVPSSKSIRKTQEKPNLLLAQNEKKLKEYMQRKRDEQQKDRINKLQFLKEQNQILMKKKERVLSACGIRNHNICDSPRIVVHKKEEISEIKPINSCKPTKKDDISLPNAKLPPRPQGLFQIPYKLPPRPNNLVNLSQNNGSNKSIEISQREQSKENLRNIGARILNDIKPVPMTPAPRQSVSRCNSAQKVVYPSWWG